MKTYREGMNGQRWRATRECIAVWRSWPKRLNPDGKAVKKVFPFFFSGYPAPCLLNALSYGVTDKALSSGWLPHG